MSNPVQYKTIQGLPLRTTPLDNNDLLLVYDGSSAKRMQWQDISNSVVTALTKQSVVANTTLDSTFAGKFYVATGSSDITITLPAATTALAGGLTTFSNALTDKQLTITGATFNDNVSAIRLMFQGESAGIIADPTANTYRVISLSRARTNLTTYTQLVGGPVPITTRQGRVTTSSYTTAANGLVTFDLTYPAILSTDCIQVTIGAGGSNTRALILQTATAYAGGFTLVFRNIDVNPLNGTFNFTYTIS